MILIFFLLCYIYEISITNYFLVVISLIALVESENYNVLIMGLLIVASDFDWVFAIIGYTIILVTIAILAFAFVLYIGLHILHEPFHTFNLLLKYTLVCD